jgi:hypothetical protein
MKARMLAALSAISASLVCVITVSAPANASSNPDVNKELFKSAAATTLCAQETGTQSTAFLGSCSATQTSDLWSGPITNRAGSMVNAHSGLCLTGHTVSPTTGVGLVDLESCSIGGAGQAWFVNSVGAGADGHGRVFQDDSGSGACLWQSVTSLQVRACDFTSSHDSWFYAVPWRRTVSSVLVAPGGWLGAPPPGTGHRRFALWRPGKP